MVRMKPANSDEVREWANDNGWRDQYDRAVSDRGRLPTSLIGDFNRAMKKHRVEYNPVARGDSQPPRSNDENRGRRPRTEVAVKEPVRSSRPAARSRDEDTTPAPRPRRETIKVQAERGDGRVSPPVAPDASVAVPASAQAFEQMVAAMAAAAGSSKGKGTPILLASYTLAYADA